MKTTNKIEVNPNIKTELDILNRILKKIPDDKKKVASGLVEQAAFMRYVLAQLQQTIYSDGSISYDSNGGIKESPAVKSYSTLINRYSVVIKDLLNLLPKQEQPEAKSDALTDFINGDKS